MSVTAIAAALERLDLSVGERLVAFSLASFANHENRAWPGAPAATARAGLSRSRYLQARDQLVRRGLVVVEDTATGRGRASTLVLRFAAEGPWSEREINAPLFEAALTYSHARGPARLLLATMAAFASEERVVDDLTTEQLCSAAGLADKTYRRARQALLASGELVLLSGVGGRGNTNRWEIPDPRLVAGELRTPAAGRRVPPPPGTRPLIASVTARVSATSQESPASCNLEALSPAGKGGQDQTLSLENRPNLTGVSGAKRGHDQTLSRQNRRIPTWVLARKGGQGQTLFAPTEAETPAERAAKTQAKTPAPNARAGREPQNQRTKQHPPNPPQGGSDAGSITIEEAYTTSRGRTRHRRVNVTLDDVRRALRVPAASDHADWERIRKLLAKTVSSGIYAIWFDPVELIGIDPDGALVLDVPSELRGWLQDRFSRVIDDAAKSAGRATRIADVGAEHSDRRVMTGHPPLGRACPGPRQITGPACGWPPRARTRKPAGVSTRRPTTIDRRCRDGLYRRRTTERRSGQDHHRDQRRGAARTPRQARTRDRH